ncbi:MAG TPA: hypothetical protein VFJ50_00760, partial [Gemmatimonadales bacterium]|nr:hypothetical protein [Gemmatimonadales bacterium]
RVAGLLSRLALPVRLQASVSRARVLGAMGSDKKNRNSQLRFALPRELGAMDEGDRWTRPAEPSAIEAALAALE